MEGKVENYLDVIYINGDIRVLLSTPHILAPAYCARACAAMLFRECVKIECWRYCSVRELSEGYAYRYICIDAGVDSSAG